MLNILFRIVFRILEYILERRPKFRTKADVNLDQNVYWSCHAIITSSVTLTRVWWKMSIYNIQLIWSVTGKVYKEKWVRRVQTFFFQSTDNSIFSTVNTLLSRKVLDIIILYYSFSDIFRKSILIYIYIWPQV